MSNLTGKIRTRVVELFFTGQKCILQVQYATIEYYGPHTERILKWRDAKPEDITEGRIVKHKF